jgi:hypothetical protein
MMVTIGDHDNVVKLVGVAVQQVPWLCVLEFQPFGDLREVVMSARCSGFKLNSAPRLRSIPTAAGLKKVYM